MVDIKYSVDSKELEKLYDDLYSIEDWIPQIILAYIPTEVHSKIGSKVKNTRLRVKRLQKHRMDGRKINGFNNYMNWEIENFILKYPQFRKVFIEI